MELAFINPVGIWEISADTGSAVRNTLGAMEVWWRPIRQLVLYGSLLIDNTKVNDPDAPQGLTQWGVAFGVQAPAITPSLAIRADLSIINSLAYRTNDARWEYYTIRDIGIARDKTDVILLDVAADWFARPGLVLKPKLVLMWKGEEDITDPFPEDGFSGGDLLLVGIVESTARPAVAGRWNFGWGSRRQWTIDAVWDLGLNIVKNDDHIVSDWDAEFVGKIGGEIRFSLLR
jgi:hypothetical protein